MIEIKINNVNFLVKKNISILEACKYVGITIPRFCYHETLSVAGNCRMCLVEVENNPKPISSCTRPIENNMAIFVDTPLVKKARENVIETLLLNHPLDCPICDQGGECDLQDQTKVFGSDSSRFFFNKRGVEDKNCGPLIKTIMTRCIHCTRCVRFGTEVAGVDFLGTLNRGTSTEIGSYTTKTFSSEISGNVIDLCPVGALTSKPYAFKARPWELKVNETIDLTDSSGSNLYVNFKETEIMRILPKNNTEINQTLISDKARFSYDAIKNHRLQKIFVKSQTASKLFELSNWPALLKKLDFLLFSKCNQKVLFLIDEELDLESLTLLKTLQNSFPNNINIKLHQKSLLTSNNAFLSWTNNRFNELKKESKYCFLLSSNVRLESAILNAKLRNKVVSQTFNVFSLGHNFHSSFPLKFVNINLDKILKIFEAKSSLSSLLVKKEFPLIIFGTSFKKRFQGTFNFLAFFKTIIPSAIILDVTKSANSTIAPFFNFKASSTNDFEATDIVFALNLEDNIPLRKNLFGLEKKIVWFNTHGSSISKQSSVLIPVLTSFEIENKYMNLEQRPQKTLKSLNGIGDARDLKKILKALYSKKLNLKKSSQSLNFLNEMIEHPNKFKTLANTLTKQTLLNSNYLKMKNVVMNYPLKSSLEDFYLSNLFTKNSKVMAQCSQGVRKTFNNFFID